MNQKEKISKKKYIPSEKQQQIFNEREFPSFLSQKYIVGIEYQKIINVLDNTNNELPKFNTSSWSGVNDGEI